GETCSAEAVVCNPGPNVPVDIPLFVILDAYGELFFAPSFNQVYDAYMIDTLTVGEHHFQILPEFVWPSGVGSANGIYWYAAMTNPEITELFGEWDMFEFGWGE
ncbi:hypothetical protein K8T06_03335, partial [bacterium]|nr:hypothetical protein [bacterium]